MRTVQRSACRHRGEERGDIEAHRQRFWRVTSVERHSRKRLPSLTSRTEPLELEGLGGSCTPGLV